MSEAQTDTLVKPDMVAVLERTHLTKDLKGFLLPVLEAISNAIHGIEARYNSQAKEKGVVKIQVNCIRAPNNFLVSVTDNGIGLDEENYKSFLTPFSGHKLKKNGRGFGRFVAFKVFSKLHYSSKYLSNKNVLTRSFRFDILKEQEIIFDDAVPEVDGTGLRVEYSLPKEEWHSLTASLNTADIADHIGTHFIPQFLQGTLPQISIQFDDNPDENITNHFRSIFHSAETGKFDQIIDNSPEEVEFSLARVPRSKAFNNHCLLFSAGDRIVGSARDISNLLGQSWFVDKDDKPYVVIAIVRSKAFESRLNDARTSINIGATVIEEIVSTVSQKIEGTEKEQIGKIKLVQSGILLDALKENPILRLGLKGRSVAEYVANKPNNWKAQEFVSNLAIERYRVSRDLNKAIAVAANNPEDYVRTIKAIVEKIDASNKEALAEYVVHRKKVIELIELARKHTSEGSFSTEDTLHDLVFRRFKDSSTTEYFEHNLWLIDDALAFLPYISSDRSMHGKGRQKGDKVADLAFFDDSLVLGDNDGTTITIIEFKRPSRDDYRFGDPKNDPVLQVIETLEGATRAGGIARNDGSHFSFSGVVRRFAYIIADIKPSLVKVLRKHDFKNDWNPDMFVRYRDNEQIFIQVLGYDTLVSHAKKRNQAFFSVLFEE